MTLNSDFYYKIGFSHKYCDDYACISDNIITNMAIISDGCSSSYKSNYGSLILPQIYIDLILSNKSNIGQEEIIYSANKCISYLNLPEQSLDATLFAIYIEQNTSNKYRIFCSGDGSIIKITKDNHIEFTYIEYPSGAPLYMNYYSNSRRLELYKEKYGFKRIIHNYKVIDNIIVDYQSITDETGESYIESGNATDYKFIGVTSDGIASFVDADKKLIENIVVVKELLNFKSYKGEFIQRRMNGFNKYCLDNGWKHSDDFSIAGIHIDA